jgi:hypothetical protein
MAKNFKISWNRNHNSTLFASINPPITREMKTKAFYAILEKVHNEIAPQLEAIRNAEDVLLKIGSVAMGGFQNARKNGKSIGCSHGFETETYSIGKLESNLAEENNPFVSCLNEGLNRAEREIRAEANSKVQIEYGTGYGWRL